IVHAPPELVHVAVNCGADASGFEAPRAQLCQSHGRDEMIKRTLAVVACVALLAACGKKADETNAVNEVAQQPDAHPAATIPTPANEAAAPDFVTKAAASDMFEVAIGRVAAQKATNPEVKKFARMMVDAHTKSTDALKAAIAASGQTLTLPAALPADL